MQIGLENTFADELEGLYVPWKPDGFPAPALLHLNEALLDELTLDSNAVRTHAAGLFSGSVVPTDAVPVAQAYAGHQFGGFSSQLGDGRAVLLGECFDRQGQRRDLQLKGSGPTPFSRGGDGQATLGPVLREYLIGEAMFHLGIPTTRALGAVTTGVEVRRDTYLPGAVLARVASSHLRVGTLEFFAARGELDKLRRLVRYALERHGPAPEDNPAQQLLNAVALRQAELIARWMLVGFVHGVMNTDNCTLSGETIDYGPCAFLDRYDPAMVFSSIDRQGRYAYGNQPRIGQWNLARMAEALLPLLHKDTDAALALAQGALDLYQLTYEGAFLQGMAKKLGLQTVDKELAADLLTWMHRENSDFTSTFRQLAHGLRTGTSPFCGPVFAAWYLRWLEQVEDPQAAAASMDRVNPLYIPRNHKVEEALSAAHDSDFEPFERLLQVLSTPYDAQPGQQAYAEPAPADFGPYRTFCGT